MSYSQTNILFFFLVEILLAISSNRQNILLENTTFNDNWATKALISVEKSKNLTVTNTKILRLNKPLGIFKDKGGPSFIIRNVLVRSFFLFTLSDCYSNRTAVGLKIFDDSGLLAVLGSFGGSVIPLVTNYLNILD